MRPLPHPRMVRADSVNLSAAMRPRLDAPLGAPPPSIRRTILFRKPQVHFSGSCAEEGFGKAFLQREGKTRMHPHRENENSCVIARSASDEAIQGRSLGRLDCFANARNDEKQEGE
jgi:hypothetical protein